MSKFLPNCTFAIRANDRQPFWGAKNTKNTKISCHILCFFSLLNHSSSLIFWQTLLFLKLENYCYQGLVFFHYLYSIFDTIFHQFDCPKLKFCLSLDKTLRYASTKPEKPSTTFRSTMYMNKGISSHTLPEDNENFFIN